MRIRKLPLIHCGSMVELESLVYKAREHYPMASVTVDENRPRPPGRPRGSLRNARQLGVDRDVLLADQAREHHTQCPMRLLELRLNPQVIVESLGSSPPINADRKPNGVVRAERPDMGLNRGGICRLAELFRDAVRFLDRLDDLLIRHPESQALVCDDVVSRKSNLNLPQILAS